MPINVIRKLSDSSLISSHICNDREEIDKYNNRPPIKKIINLSEETEIDLNCGGENMDAVGSKKMTVPKDYKTSIFFTGFHHKAYVENVRPRSTSPPLPPIPYTKKPQTPSTNMPKNPRHSLIRDFPKTHNAELTVKPIFPNRAMMVTRSTSPINIKSLETDEPITTLENIPNEMPSKEIKERSKCEEEAATVTEAEDLDQLQESSKPMEHPIRDETITPSKILRHFQFKHSDTNGIPKDIPEKLLNRSQRSHFDEAFREIVQSGNGSRFELDSKIRNEEFVKVGQKSRYSKTFQGDPQKNGANSEGISKKEVICSNHVSKTISNQSLHKCQSCKYSCQKEAQRLDIETEERVGCENVSHRDDGTKRKQFLDEGRGTKSDDAFLKKIYQKGSDLRNKTISDGVLPNETSRKFQNDLQPLSNSEDREKSKESVCLKQKFSQNLNVYGDGLQNNQENNQFKKINRSNLSRNQISEVLYKNYAQCNFSENNFGADMDKEQHLLNNTINKFCLDPVLARENNKNSRFNQGKCCMGRLENRELQSETWKYYQHTSAHMLNNSNDFLEAHHRVSATGISFNSPKRPSSVPPLKTQRKKYQNPREIQLNLRNYNSDDKPIKSNQRKRTLIESIKSMAFPGVTSKDKDWKGPRNDGEHLKFPKETKNAVMMMLSGAKSKALWKTDERHQAGVRQVQMQIPASYTQTCVKLPCSKNLLCEKGLHSGKCRKFERAVMKYSKPCLCREKQFWCSECQNIWPGSAKRCETTSSDEMGPENAFLQIMEPKWPTEMEKKLSGKHLYQQDLICNLGGKMDQ